MQLTADQALRKELLLYSLDREPEIEAAIAMAVQMERFILEGRPEKPFPPIPNAEKVVGDDKASGSDAAAALPGTFGRGGTKRRWTDSDDAKLKELWHTAATLEEIAEVLERTIPSLYSRARALGLAKRAQKPQEDATALRHPRAEGLNGNTRSKAETAARTNGQHAVASKATAADAGARRSEAKLERFCPKSRRASQMQRARNGGATSAHTGVTAVKSSRIADDELGIDPVIQFLRSRDYSVVRVGDGRFKLDGRRILSVDELREKANQVRKTLGQPPFASQGAVCT